MEQPCDKLLCLTWKHVYHMQLVGTQRCNSGFLKPLPSKICIISYNCLMKIHLCRCNDPYQIYPFDTLHNFCLPRSFRPALWSWSLINGGRCSHGANAHVTAKACPIGEGVGIAPRLCWGLVGGSGCRWPLSPLVRTTWVRGSES